MPGLLACRPPLEHRYKFLPTVSDFMQLDDSTHRQRYIRSDFTKKQLFQKSKRKKAKRTFSAKQYYKLTILKRSSQ